MIRFIRKVFSGNNGKSHYVVIPTDVYRAWNCKQVEILFDGRTMVVCPVSEASDATDKV